jgi:glutamine amidotransferase
MLLEPMYLLSGRNFEDYEESYDIDVRPIDDATSVLFASEPLTEADDDWSTLDFGELVALERHGDDITKNVSTLNL